MNIEEQIRKECEYLSQKNPRFSAYQHLYIKARRDALDGTFTALEKEHGIGGALDMLSARESANRESSFVTRMA
jgi:hypothetical protein